MNDIAILRHARGQWGRWVSLVTLMAMHAAAGAAELPVKQGLLLWLDASTQAAERQRAALPPLLPGQGADLLLDASDQRARFVQPLAERRPVLMTDGGAAFLRFDGKDDFLFLDRIKGLTPELTLFVLAAPKANPGGYSALFASSTSGGNDYTHGLNVDFGYLGTERLSHVSVESAGAAGGKDLLVENLLGPAERPFGGFHLFTIRSKMGKDGMEFFLDGLKSGSRDRLESQIGLDRMVLGARLFSNDPALAPFVQGFLKGDLAAVAVYDRALSEEERLAVEKVLLERMPALEAVSAGIKGHGLETVANPPAVQMLVPGFEVEELPLKLGNLTNIRYRHDGELVALGYDGRLHLLSDTDHDGAPDKAEVWWDKAPLKGPIGLALLPAGDARGEGVFVASKAKLSLLLDRDRDGQAEEEIVVATGWPETFHGVDTLGVAVHPQDGSVYFSIGCTNFADGYLRDASGKSTYRLDSPRGTVQRMSADLKTRETVATGVRFLCALAFNRQGDLFATEQEGATWLPNGNPLDELLHIVPGRHYGFPPRHPRHLPDVIDEPAVMEYGPQHQSTCGMVFNEGVNGGPSFGPAHWQGDALVCGESRGKLWRTKLAKTQEGYVAQSQLIACLNALTVDACVSPLGDLLVACHTGPPDWGTGPAGEGRLFRLKWTQPELPQPVTAWAAAPDEFRIAFDRPLVAADWRNLKEKVRIEAGTYVSAGDRFETMRPGYQVVRDQLASPRRWVEVSSLLLTGDGRTLILKIPPQTEPVNYAVTLPIPESWRIASPFAQAPEMDLLVTLNGVEARSGEGAAGPGVILPQVSLAVSQALTKGSADHEAFFAGGGKEVGWRSRVKVDNIFQPATQPGSALDWDIGADAFANRRMLVRQVSPENLIQPAGPAGSILKETEGSLTDLSLTVPTGGRLIFKLGDHVRPVSPHRLFVPWMSPAAPVGTPAAAVARTDVKGNWLHGRRLFFGRSTCSTCHTLRGEGMAFGPDLSNLIHRDRHSVLADIVKPSATINPDHAATQFTLKNGSQAAGIIVSSGAGKVTISLPAGMRQELLLDDIVSSSPLKASLMPEGLHASLNETEMEDLLTFLLTVPLEPSHITRLDPGPPPARPMAEITPHLPAPGTVAAASRPLRILLSAGKKDHGLNEHDYPLWLDRWSKLLGLADNVTVATCMDFPSRELLESADVVVFHSSNAGWDLRAAMLLDEFQQRGGGLVYLHWSIEGHQHARELADRVGLAFSFSAFRHGVMDLTFTSVRHPVTAGFDAPIQFIDESYWRLHGDTSRFSILGTSLEDQEPRPQLWSREQGGSRVLGCIPGHYTWTFDDPLYRILILRGICWAAREPDPHRLAELSLVGARLGP